ncbi:MAG: GNAT family N-acetyltransferase [Desulfobacteraceae bacterium]|nr:GNAT family N-acetyltransferase [Desulfobacteraceae bacterium]
MDLKSHCPKKVVTAKEAIAEIKNGSRILIGTGCGEPQHLIRTMVKNTKIQDVMVYQMLSWTMADYVNDPNFLRRFALKLFFISSRMRRAAFEGKIDYIPAYLSQIPKLFESQRIGLDVALVQVSPPDRHGFCSLGVSVDITRSGMNAARLVIAQVNPKMPHTWGDSIVHLDEIDYFVEYEEPLVESVTVIKNQEVALRIGYYVNQLIEDGATLQIGFGYMPNAILPHLTDKKDLGIHTQLITDAFIPLLENKIITNKRKTLLEGKVVASLCMGTEKLYKYVDNNPQFYFRSSEFVNDPTVIARNDNFISISSALEVDLTGQVCTDSMNHIFYSGIGDQVDFLRGSAMSKGGFSIIAMPSTAQGDNVSRIVSSLNEGAGVATTRGDVNFVVTEYGIAELEGKSIFQRVMELSQIAHPKFRKDLIEAAKKHHYIFPDQLPPLQDDLIFLEKYKKRHAITNGKVVEFRPLLPSDEFEFRNFYYSLKAETIYMRFFHKMKLFSHEVAQQQWASVDYRQNMSMIGLCQKGGHREIVAIGSYADDGTKRAEIAFVVREDFQGLGVASILLAQLETIARENGFKGFTAMVLEENKAMVRVFKNQYPHAKVTYAGVGEMQIVMDFDPPEVE